MDNIKENVKQIISEQLSVEMEQLTGKARLIDDLNADSLDVVELTMALEDRFNITIEEEQAEQMATVDDIIYSITAAVSRAAP